MVRRHGWQPPAHGFQVAAITVFFLLAVSFYVILAPFFWSYALEVTALATYSILAFAVFSLYIRSAAMDPADSGALIQLNRVKQKVIIENPLLDGSMATPGMLEHSTSLSGRAMDPSKISAMLPSNDWLCHSAVPSHVGPPQMVWTKKKSRLSISRFFAPCVLWVTKDDTCMSDFELQKPTPIEDVLFCTLCNAEVGKLSKHCRTCDKCVDGFDHHCRWINNCVGRKNYNTFISLMATSLTLLFLEWGIGMAVLVRCFVDKIAIEHEIVDNLGSNFSRVPLATIVAICTLVSFLTMIPLGELFFFHLLLIRKGITTYEYVVALRAQNEPQALSNEGDQRSCPISPSSSTTGWSHSSSLGAQPDNTAWCTPPRELVEHEDEKTSQGSSLTIDRETAAEPPSKCDNQQVKNVVRISAWKLSKLSANEATKAGVKARENSTILRPVGSHEILMGTRSTRNQSFTSNSSNNDISIDYTGDNRGGSTDEGFMTTKDRSPSISPGDHLNIKDDPDFLVSQIGSGSSAVQGLR